MKGFVIAVVVTIVGFLAIDTVMDNRAMEQCQKHYSFDTCFRSLHR